MKTKIDFKPLLMRRLVIFALVLLASVTMRAQIINARYSFQDSVGNPASVNKITQTPLAPAWSNGTNEVTLTPITLVTGTNGTATFSNTVVGGNYSYSIVDRAGVVTSGTNGFPVGLTNDPSGYVNARTWRGVKVGPYFAYFVATNFNIITNLTTILSTNVTLLTNTTVTLQTNITTVNLTNAVTVLSTNITRLTNSTLTFTTNVVNGTATAGTNAVVVTSGTVTTISAMVGHAEVFNSSNVLAIAQRNGTNDLATYFGTNDINGSRITDTLTILSAEGDINGTTNYHGSNVVGAVALSVTSSNITGTALTTVSNIASSVSSSVSIGILVVATNKFARTNDPWWDISGTALLSTNPIPGWIKAQGLLNTNQSTIVSNGLAALIPAATNPIPAWVQAVTNNGNIVFTNSLSGLTNKVAFTNGPWWDILGTSLLSTNPIPAWIKAQGLLNTNYTTASTNPIPGWITAQGLVDTNYANTNAVRLVNLASNYLASVVLTNVGSGGTNSLAPPVSIDTTNTFTNYYGGALSILGLRVQEGLTTGATGAYSHAEGNFTHAYGTESHAEGYNSMAIGRDSHAEGANTTASSTYSHAEGFGTTASGSHSHSEGLATLASGAGGHAEGSVTVAGGYASHAGGRQSTAAHDFTFVWSDDWPFVSTTYWQFLIHARNGVGINTNNPGTNSLQVFGNIEANNYTINGANITSLIVNPTNGITSTIATNIADSEIARLANTNNYVAGSGVTLTPTSPGIVVVASSSGVGSTIGISQTNVFSNQILLIGTNQIVNGTNVYYYDGNTNSAAWTDYTTRTWISPNLNLVYYATTGWMWFINTNGGYSANQMPSGVWTNTTPNTNEIILGQSGVYSIGTNYSGDQFLYTSTSVNGVWTAINGATNPPIGVVNPSSTNVSTIPIIANGQFTPIKHQFIIPDGSSSKILFTVNHGLGHVPKLVEWSYACVHADPATGWQPGDVLGRYPVNNTAYNDGKNSDSVWTEYHQPPMAGPAINIPIKGAVYGGSTSATITSESNFVLQVEFYP